MVTKRAVKGAAVEEVVVAEVAGDKVVVVVVLWMKFPIAGYMDGVRTMAQCVIKLLAMTILLSKSDQPPSLFGLIMCMALLKDKDNGRRGLLPSNKHDGMGELDREIKFTYR